jgi:hypothetical protein
MALFEVPGWSVPATVSNPAATGSKKRKQPLKNDTETIHAAQINLERLVKKLKVGKEAERTRNRRKHGNKNKDSEIVGQGEGPTRQISTGKTASSSSSPKAKISNVGLSTIPNTFRSEKTKKKAGIPRSKPQPSKQAGTSGLTALQKGFKQNLEGARFR